MFRNYRIVGCKFDVVLLLADMELCFFQGRVTDHRVGVTEHGIESVMNGERLTVFADALQLRHQAELLAQLGQS